MFAIEQLDDSTSFMQQLQEATGTVVLINIFVVPEGTQDEVVKVWHDDADLMKAQPGFISAQLHRGTGSSRSIVNVAVWESTDALRAAITSPAFAEKAADYPDGVKVYPLVVQKVAVDGVCVD